MSAPLDYEPPRPKSRNGILPIAPLLLFVLQIPWFIAYIVVGLMTGAPDYYMTGRREANLEFSLQFAPALVGVVVGTIVLSTWQRYPNKRLIVVVLGTTLCAAPIAALAPSSLRLW